MSTIRCLAALFALIPAIAYAGECRIEHRKGSWLSYFEDCPEDVSDLVFRHSICEYAYDTFKDTRTSEKIKKDTQEVMFFRKCDELPCDKERILAANKDKPDLVKLVNEAYGQMDMMYHSDMNHSPYDAACQH